MSDQLQLDLAATTADSPPASQLSELPGTEWEHIFGLPAPSDGPDGPFGPFKHPREDS